MFVGMLSRIGDGLVARSGDAAAIALQALLRDGMRQA